MRRLSLLCVVLTMLVAAPALAQEPTTTEGTTTTGETTTGETTAPADPDGQQQDAQDGDSDEDNRWLAVAVLLFGSAVIIGLLVYLRDIQSEHYKAVGKSIAAGLGMPEPAPTTAFVDADRDAAPDFEIKGPGVITVTRPTEFKAERETTPVTADWAVESVGPEQGAQATVDPAQGEATTLTAAAVGTYKLTATVDGTSTSVVVAAMQPAGNAAAPKLAWVGEGYGTIIVAVTVVATVTVLGLLDVLDSSALAGLFGALVGYIFLKSATGNGGGGTGGGQGDTQTGNGA